MKLHPFDPRCGVFTMSIAEAIQIVLGRPRREPLLRSIPALPKQPGSGFVRKNTRNKFHRFTFGKFHA